MYCPLGFWGEVELDLDAMVSLGVLFCPGSVRS